VINTIEESCKSVDDKSADEIFQLIFNELRVSTNASEKDCTQVAERLAAEVNRICTESKRIQTSGRIKSWAVELAKHRLDRCLHYYKLGSRRGRVDLHSSLSAVVYRYITPPQTQASYQARLTLIEDFLQGFYIEALSACRRENQLPTTYQPKTLLQLAEYMAFTERFGKRRIPLPRNRNQQLIILRAQTFSQQQPSETLVDIERAAEGGSSDGDSQWQNAPMQEIREQMGGQQPEQPEDTLRENVINKLIEYLEDRKQPDCVKYFVLRLNDRSASEIESILRLTSRQRDYLQQRFKYHLIRFALSHEWELVHQWLEADLERNLGLTSYQWQAFLGTLPPLSLKLIDLKRQKLSDSEIAKTLGCTLNQLQKQWFKLLEQAWEIRNDSDSGESLLTDE
jgi:hypothetical protein